jgi:putative peptide zinc metalloprotease protein
MHTLETNPLDIDYGALRADLLTSFQDTTQGRRVVLHHPTNGRNFLCSESAFQLLRTLQPGLTARHSLRASFPDAVLQSPHTASLLASASAAGLFTLSAASTSSPLPSVNPFFIRVPIFNPQSLISPLRPIARFLYHPWTVRLWLAAFLFVLAFAASQWRYFLATITVFTNFHWWPTLYAAMAGSAILHELSHVMMADRFGVPVKQVGLLFYFLSPGAYADVSQAWLLPNRRHRIAIALAGVYAESFVWVIATALWLTLRHGPVASTCLLLATCLLSRMLINLIPFLRLDGYWVLSDFLGIPNLRGSAFNCLLARIPLLRGFVPPSKRSRRENSILLTYAGAALLFNALAVTVMLANFSRLFSTLFPESPFGSWAAPLLGLTLLIWIGIKIAPYFDILRRNNSRLAS